MMQYYWQLHIKGWKSAMVWIVFQRIQVISVVSSYVRLPAVGRRDLPKILLNKLSCSGIHGQVMMANMLFLSGVFDTHL